MNTRWIRVIKKIIVPEIFSRVSGYFRPVQNWNKGKKEEFSERKALQMNKRDVANNAGQ
jgi:hypothetical protein